MIIRNKIIVLILVLLSVHTIATAQHSFTVDAPRVVEQNEFFNVVYSANGEVSKFNPPSFKGLEVLAGPTLSTSYNTEIINGSRRDRVEFTYTYVLRAKISKGKAYVSSASAVVGGKTYTAGDINIDVVANSGSGNSNSSRNSSAGYSDDSQMDSPSNGNVSNNDIFLSLSFSKTKVVKGEPIIATLKLFTRVSIAGFEDIKFPVFNGFWSQEIETPQNINFNRERYNNKIYSAAVLRKYLLLPQQTGTIKIDPAEMICQVQLRGQSGGRSVFDDFFDNYQIVKKRIYSQSTKINVTPLPGGAPVSYGGGVGSFKMSVNLSRDNVKAHEAASVIVNISGQGNLNLIEAPKVNFPADFEKYDVKTNNSFTNGSSGISGAKQFEYPFIPRSEGVFEIPAITYSYYNIQTGKYVTLQSQPLSVKVAKGDPNASNTMVSGINKQDVVNLDSDIRYIFIGAPHLQQRGHFFIGGILFFLILALIIIGYFIIRKVLLGREKLRGDVRRSRNRKANKIAKSRLNQANIYLSKNLPVPFYEEIHKALLGYISDKLFIQFADMQRDTIKETLISKKVTENDIESLMSLLDDCEMARYSQEGSGESMDKVYERAIGIISDFENKL